MPEISVNGATIHYEDEGPANPKGTILFAHGLLWSGWMFEKQAAHFKDRYRCVRFDFRGQGRSEVTASGYDMDTLTADAVALIDALKLGRVHMVGLSMGGFVGMRLAARHADRVASLALLETSADQEPPENVPQYRAMGFVARWLGLSLVASRVMPIMFGRPFLTDPARKAEREDARKRLLANDRAGIVRALGGVIFRKPIYEELSEVRCPTVVIVGEEDRATRPEKAERIAAKIPGALLVKIQRAGHTSSVEEPEAVNAAIERHLARI